jgi:hypothetical protein
MRNILADYMKSRMDKKANSVPFEDFGPIVTISREYGCPAKIVAQDLGIKLNNVLFRANRKEQWRWISKEILEESATELKMDKSIVKSAVNADDRGVMDQLIWSLSNKFYPGEDKVKKTLADVIREFTREGRVIIVGRAGVSLTREVKNSLHIRLVAPIDWRAKIVSERKQIPYEKAIKMCKEIDIKRDHLREYFEHKKPDNSIFDLVFNYKTLTQYEILEMITRIMELRRMV